MGREKRPPNLPATTRAEPRTWLVRAHFRRAIAARQLSNVKCPTGVCRNLSPRSSFPAGRKSVIAGARDGVIETPARANPYSGTTLVIGVAGSCSAAHPAASTANAAASTTTTVLTACTVLLVSFALIDRAFRLLGRTRSWRFRRVRYYRQSTGRRGVLGR